MFNTKVIFFLLLLTLPAYLIQANNLDIQYKWELSEDLLLEAQVYYAAFKQAYTNFDLAKVSAVYNVQINDFTAHATNVMQKERLLAQDSKTVFGLTAFDNDKLVGFMICDVSDDIAKIRQIAVHPDYWGHKIGENLILQIFDHFTNVGKIVLVAWKDNPKALPFYRKIGFVQTDYRDTHYNPNEFIGLELDKKG